LYQHVKKEYPSWTLDDKDSQIFNSSLKSTRLFIFYTHNCCKNNKFELFLHSLFGIINPKKDIYLQ